MLSLAHTLPILNLIALPAHDEDTGVLVGMGVGVGTEVAVGTTVGVLVGVGYGV